MQTEPLFCKEEDCNIKKSFSKSCGQEENKFEALKLIETLIVYLKADTFKESNDKKALKFKQTTSEKKSISNHEKTLDQSKKNEFSYEMPKKLYLKSKPILEKIFSGKNLVTATFNFFQTQSNDNTCLNKKINKISREGALKLCTFLLTWGIVEAINPKHADPPFKDLQHVHYKFCDNSQPFFTGKSMSCNETSYRENNENILKKYFKVFKKRSTKISFDDSQKIDNFKDAKGGGVKFKPNCNSNDLNRRKSLGSFFGLNNKKDGKKIKEESDKNLSNASICANASNSCRRLSNLKAKTEILKKRSNFLFSMLNFKANKTENDDHMDNDAFEDFPVFDDEEEESGFDYYKTEEFRPRASINNESARQETHHAMPPPRSTRRIHKECIHLHYPNSGLYHHHV